MKRSDGLRWQQRHDNFGIALGRLEEACARPQLSELERAGLVQVFQFTFELTWKTLKDLLFHEGIDAGTPRAVLRAAFAAGHISEAETEALLDALEKRNLLAHTYQERLAAEAQRLITEIYAPCLRRVFDSLQVRRSEP